MQIPKRVLVITRHVGYSIKLKESLERDNQFVVTAFASAINALSYLPNAPQDVVLVDFTVRDLAGEQIIQQIRTIQPDIGIIVAPNHPTIQNTVSALNVQYIVDLPMPIRQLASLLLNAIEAMYHAQPDTATLQTIEDENDTQQFSPTELEDTESEAQAKADAIFQKILAEEPPMPSFEESATVHDLIHNLLPEGIAQSLDVLEETTPSEDETPRPNEDSRHILAVQILETAMDTSTPVNELNLGSVIERVSEYYAPTPYVGEPDFLLPELLLDDSTHLDYTATTTSPAQVLPVLADIQNAETDRLVPIVRSKPVETLEETIATPPVPSTINPLEVNPTPEAPSPAPLFDSRLTQLALMLTRASLELTAEALILSRGEEIIAYSGQVPMAEVQEIKHEFASQTNEESPIAKVHFITMPSSGTDYMLYTQPTSDGLVLSLLFAGTMPLGAIRRQGKRLMEALATVPEPVPAPLENVKVILPDEVADSANLPIETAQPITSSDSVVLPEPTEISSPSPETTPIELAPYSFVWILRDTTLELNSLSAQRIVMGLDVELTTQGWKIYTLDVYEDCVYLRTDAPLHTPAKQLVHQLMSLSATIVHGVLQNTDPRTLWADSYLIVRSDRLLGIEEIQEFIDFARQ